MDELKKLLAAQREAFIDSLPVSADVRKDRLKRIIRMMTVEGEKLCTAMSDDFGHRSREQSMMTDIVPSISTAKDSIRRLRSWMRPERRTPMFPLGFLGASARVEYQPKGVVGVIVPWNFPVLLALSPVCGAFAAGNRVMVKLSEYTPRTSELMAEVGARYFSPDELAFVNGGPEMGQAFASLDFDHLVFTGATPIGRHILHAAADNLTPVTLELGGKSPTIFGRSANLDQATERVALGKMMNAGQVCLAPDYLLVPHDLEHGVVEGVKGAVGRMYPTLLANPDYTSVVNGRHYDRLNALLDDAREKGARIEAVNPGGEDFGASNGHKMPLHIVRNVNDDMRLMQEEIFGPILPVKTYDRIEQAIDYVNTHDRPLGLYYFGSDRAEERKVLDRTISGGVTVDDVIFHTAMEDLPFGGVGPSGMGSYHGIDGFRTFSHAKAIYRQTKIDVAKIGGLKPPYGAVAHKNIAREFKEPG